MFQVLHAGLNTQSHDSTGLSWMSELTEGYPGSRPTKIHGPGDMVYYNNNIGSIWRSAAEISYHHAGTTLKVLGACITELRHLTNRHNGTGDITELRYVYTLPQRYWQSWDTSLTVPQWYNWGTLLYIDLCDTSTHTVHDTVHVCISNYNIYIVWECTCHECVWFFTDRACDRLLMQTFSVIFVSLSLFLSFSLSLSLSVSMKFGKSALSCLLAKV